jgi:hypothetical protein
LPCARCGSRRPGHPKHSHLAAIDLCRIAGAETYGTTSASKDEFVRSRGLDHPIDYRTKDYVSALGHGNTAWPLAVAFSKQAGVRIRRRRVRGVAAPFSVKVHRGIASRPSGRGLISAGENYALVSQHDDSRRMIGVDD